MNYRFSRKVNDDGTITGSSDINRAVESFAGKDVEIIIQKPKKKRSTEQNSLFWSYMSILGYDLGYTKDEMKKIVCAKFLTQETVIEKTGEIICTVKGTSELTTKEFTDLLEGVLQWAVEDFGTILPLPNQQVEIEL